MANKRAIISRGELLVASHVSVFWVSTNCVRLSHSLHRPQTSLKGTSSCPAASSAASSWVWPRKAAHAPQPLLSAHHFAYVPLRRQPLDLTNAALWLVFRNKLNEETVLNMKAWSVVTVLSHALLPSLVLNWIPFQITLHPIGGAHPQKMHLCFVYFIFLNDTVKTPPISEWSCFCVVLQM